MSISLSYTFVHGFGCSSSFWDRIVSTFPFPFTVWERGYYGKEESTEVIASEYRIGIGHSLGLVHLLCSDIPFDMYIGVQSFIDFLGVSEYARRKESLDTMYSNLMKNTQGTLIGFCKQGGLRYSRESRINEKRLYSDFLMLYERFYEKSKNKKIVLIGTQDDPIVPLELIADNFPNMNIHIAPNAKHALGYLEYEYLKQYCLSFSKIIPSKDS